MPRDLLTYVNRIENNIVCVTSYSEKMINELIKIGFSKELVIRPKNQDELIKILSKIRDMGIPFASDYKRFSPDCYVSMCRVKGLLSGKYKVISWRNLDNCCIMEVDESGNKVLVQELVLLPKETAKLQDNSLAAKSLRFIFSKLQNLKNEIINKLKIKQ